jgi:hypothetical protein
VTAVDRIRAAIAEIPAIDHHAHLLAGPDATVELADVLTETTDAAQVAQVQEHPAYERARRELAEVLGPEPGARRPDHASQVQRLLGACRLEAMYVDDGFRFDGALTLAEHAALVGCPVRRIVRIESVAESLVETSAAGAGWPPFAELRAGFQQAIASALGEGAGDGAVALKTIAAYRCGLDLPAPSVATAAAGYESWRRSGTGRLTDAALIAQLIADALAVAGRAVPLQIHTGLGDADQMLAGADPALLQPHIDHGMLAGVPVVLLHCYPFVRHAGYLASLYAGVHLDLSLALTLIPHRGGALVGEALELAPPTKLLFATDASRLPEMFLLGTRWWREALARALGQLVDDGFADVQRALDWARLILAGNARRLYGTDAAA